MGAKLLMIDKDTDRVLDFLQSQVDNSDKFLSMLTAQGTVITKLETAQTSMNEKIDLLTTSVNDMKTDIDKSKHKWSSFEGSKKTLLWVIGVLTSVGGLLIAYFKFIGV